MTSEYSNIACDVQDGVARITLNRPPVSSETGAGRSYLASLRKKFPNAIDDLDAWQSFCRILMASNEFLYLE